MTSIAKIINEYDAKISTPWSRITARPEYGGRYVSGNVITRWGIVDASSGVLEDDGCTMLEFSHGGRLYNRRFAKDYSARYMVTLANRFAREIALLPPSPTEDNNE